MIPEHAHGERTNSFATGYFAVIKNTNSDRSVFSSEYDIVDVPLTNPLADGWEFCARDEAHAYITKIEGGSIDSTMFRLI